MKKIEECFYAFHKYFITKAKHFAIGTNKRKTVDITMLFCFPALFGSFKILGRHITQMKYHISLCQSSNYKKIQTPITLSLWPRSKKSYCQRKDPQKETKHNTINFWSHEDNEWLFFLGHKRNHKERGNSLDLHRKKLTEISKYV